MVEEKPCCLLNTFPCSLSTMGRPLYSPRSLAILATHAHGRDVSRLVRVFCLTTGCSFGALVLRDLI